MPADGHEVETSTCNESLLRLGGRCCQGLILARVRSSCQDGRQRGGGGREFSGKRHLSPASVDRGTSN